MSFDFTLAKYSELLQALKTNGYRFVTFEQYCSDKMVSEQNYVVLRHDVDLKVENS